MKFLLIFCFFGYFNSVFSQLRLTGVKCGGKYCGVSEYCSEFDDLCRPCNIICDNGSHNIDSVKCEKDCQCKFYLK